MKTLVIEDDLSIIDLVTLTFNVAWPDLKVVSSQLGREGIELAEAEIPDFIILDLGLPDMNGIDVLQRIRQFSDVPIIVLTVKRDEIDMVVALNKGADEYVCKPFRQMELISRIKNVLKRLHPSEGKEYTFGKLGYYPILSKIVYNENEIKLTPTENIVFLQLINNKTGMVTYRNFSLAIWGDEYPGSNKAIRVVVNQLRKKIYRNLNLQDLIENKPGMGYYLNPVK